MATVREHRQRINLTRQTRLYRARQERRLHLRRVNQQIEYEIFDSLEHNRRVEEELLDGPKQEREAVWDDSYRY
jgi:hypothetical protein